MQKTQRDVMHLGWIVESGFHSFRIATYNGEAPDFSKAVTV